MPLDDFGIELVVATGATLEEVIGGGGGILLFGKWCEECIYVCDSDTFAMDSGGGFLFSGRVDLEHCDCVSEVNVAGACLFSYGFLIIVLEFAVCLLVGTAELCGFFCIDSDGKGVFALDQGLATGGGIGGGY